MIIQRNSVPGLLPRQLRVVHTASTAPAVQFDAQTIRQLAAELKQQGFQIATEAPAPATAPSRSDAAQIGGALRSLVVAGGASGVAGTAWSMSRMGQTHTAAGLAKTLAQHHVPQSQAEELAKQFMAAVQDPWVKGGLIAVSAGAGTLVLLEKTDFSWRKKLGYAAAVTGAAALALIAAYQLGGFR